jgi:hypothetical protein
MFGLEGGGSRLCSSTTLTTRREMSWEGPKTQKKKLYTNCLGVPQVSYLGPLLLLYILAIEKCLFRTNFYISEVYSTIKTRKQEKYIIRLE